MGSLTTSCGFPLCPFPTVFPLPSREHLALESVQFSSVARVRLFATPWTAAGQASLSITNSPSLLKLTPTNWSPATRWWC